MWHPDSGGMGATFLVDDPAMKLRACTIEEFFIALAQHLSRVPKDEDEWQLIERHKKMLRDKMIQMAMRARANGNGFKVKVMQRRKSWLERE